ncbi:unnamed protein product [Arctia plantaginis]|uniref:Uncharacterized protein n=1 Tax=Arctia plantaginis TaxID=874455 RepID=A0A8S1A9X2_ARCPL|nr:unnamed protein product [Arctia plantaginis]
MQIAGVEVHVAGLDRNREPEPTLSQPIGEMLTACLDRILRSPTPLKVTMEQWLSTRMTAPNVDWALIDELVAWLTMRFVPQPEVLRDGAGGAETQWLPPAYSNVAYATHGLPECTALPEESNFYFHDHATTFTDNVFVTRALANTAPALRVGAWTNEAELITGLGIATYVHSERGVASNEEGTAMALDDVERVMLKRRLYEEWKRGVGISDQAVSPELMGNDRAFWDTIVYGAGEESDSVSSIGEYALGIASRAQLSWEANAQAEGVMTTLTGVRTPLALNLSDVTERGRYTFMDNERMQHMKGVSGHWLENRVGHEGLEKRWTTFNFTLLRNKIKIT